MRIKLVFKRTHGEVIPFNVKYEIGSWIYEFLHIGYEDPFDYLAIERGFLRNCYDPREFNGFTFSNLYTSQHYKVESNGFYFYPSKESFILFISFYGNNFRKRERLINHYCSKEHRINGFLMGIDPLILGPTHLRLSQIQILRPPNLADNEYFIPFSPITCSRNFYGEIKYLKPRENAFYDALKINLRKKYTKLTGKSAPHDIEIQSAYGLMQDEIFDSERIGVDTIIAFNIPIKMTGDSNIMKVAYETGIGELNSLGFGMLEQSKSLDLEYRSFEIRLREPESVFMNRWNKARFIIPEYTALRRKTRGFERENLWTREGNLLVSLEDNTTIFKPTEFQIKAVPQIMTEKIFLFMPKKKGNGKIIARIFHLEEGREVGFANFDFSAIENGTDGDLPLRNLNIDEFSRRKLKKLITDLLKDTND